MGVDSPHSGCVQATNAGSKIWGDLDRCCQFRATVIRRIIEEDSKVPNAEYHVDEKMIGQG